MFLSDLEGRSVALARAGATAVLHFGQGNAPLEVVFWRVPVLPDATQLRNVWNERQGGRPAPVLLVCTAGDRCTVVGPTTAEQFRSDSDLDQIERLCRYVLVQPSPHSALRLLSDTLPEIGSETPGLRNVGLLSTHELRNGVRRRSDWEGACRNAQSLAGKQGRDLITGLDFRIHPLAGPVSLLTTVGNEKEAIAVFLDRSETADMPLERFNGLSAVQYALDQADREHLTYVIVHVGRTLRLYTTAPGAGVGHRGRTETFVEIHLDLLKKEHTGYLWLLFSAPALARNGTVRDIMHDSSRFSAELGARLRERIYDRVLPGLAQAILQAQHNRTPSPRVLESSYRMSLTLLFRLLFIAYAEDLNLLPYNTNATYCKEKSLKTLAHALLDTSQAARVTKGLWKRLQDVFDAINRGRPNLSIPPYNGGLFSDEPGVSSEGAALANLALADDALAVALQTLLVDEGPDGRGPVDFRSLGVREFGTIYEGLLENSLSVAEVDLAVDAEGRYRPAKKGDKVVVTSGTPYLGTTSGERKSTGSYYTKRFAVEHLLEHSLEPALDAHLKRLDFIQKDHEAADAFFDFRVADLSMGSGHFLVGAIDRIERSLSNYLARRALPAVTDELDRLRTKAQEAMRAVGADCHLESAQLLRRQIACRCIYGVDINPQAVSLAQLSVWIHTFLPGLPLSVLSHNLVIGNSVAGVGTLDEAMEVLEVDKDILFASGIRSAVEEACKPLKELAHLSEVDAEEIRKARKAINQAHDALKPVSALFDILTAGRLEPSLQDLAIQLAGGRLKTIADSKEHRKARETLGDIVPFHFPLAFPEVFARIRPGFDVIVGNPPWEEATIEEDGFWGRWEPGLQGFPEHEKQKLMARYRNKHPERLKLLELEQARLEAIRRVLTSGQYPGMGTGDPDLYKAFCWRFLRLLAPGGRMGVVLPRTALSAKGSGDWRRELFASARIEDMTMLLNTGGWVFSGTEPRYTIALASILATPPENEVVIPLKGPFNSYRRYVEGIAKPPVRINLETLRSAGDALALPLLPSPESAEIWLQLRKAPRLDLNRPGEWRARPYAELHATNEKHLMKLTEDPPDNYWPVFKGESFGIWESDRGPETYYAWADPKKMRGYLQEKRERGASRKVHGEDSPFGEFPKAWWANHDTLPCLYPRIAFRDVTNRTNNRTVIAALVPPQVFITNKGPYLLWPRGNEQDQAYLLGILCSIPLDWYARCHVETNLNYFVFNPLPIPLPARTDARWKRVVALAGRLATQDKRLRPWAKAVGVECGRLKDEAREDMMAELDAVVAHLYGLSERQVRHVFETFHEGWDYAERLESVLRHLSRLGRTP